MRWHTRQRGFLLAMGGFSVIEVLLVLVILSFGLAGIVELFATSMKQGSHTEQKLKMSLLARQQSEVLRGAGLEALRAYYEKNKNESGVAYYPAKPQLIAGMGKIYWIARLQELKEGKRLTLSIAVNRNPDLSAQESFIQHDGYILKESGWSAK